ncbi:MAG: hypothetical protein AAF242_06520, partial [Bacteroidota bacterium]
GDVIRSLLDADPSRRFSASILIAHLDGAVTPRAMHAQNARPQEELEVARTGTAAQLVELLKSGTSSVKELAVETIRERFEDDADQSNRIAITRAGAIAPLVELVTFGSAKAKEEAADALDFFKAPIQACDSESVR